MPDGTPFATDEPDVPESTWALGPDTRRVDLIDLTLRRGLAESFRYLNQSGATPETIDWGRLDGLLARLEAGPVSPWTFALYSKFVVDLSKGRAGDAADDFDAVVRAASLPAAPGIVGIADGSVPTDWWDHFLVLFDTDPRRRFRFVPPDRSRLHACKSQIERALAVHGSCDPAFRAETSALLRMIVLGSQPPTERGEAFNGASMFFLWRGVLLNADPSRSVARMIDVLVHESSHVLLFGIAGNSPLTRNDGTERHPSALRSDERPIDGIFHACFVTTRVHLAMRRLLDSGSLSAEDKAGAAERLQHNASAARSALETLTRHAEPTKRGAAVLDGLRAYWSAAGAD